MIATFKHVKFILGEKETSFYIFIKILLILITLGDIIISNRRKNLIFGQHVSIHFVLELENLCTYLLIGMLKGFYKNICISNIYFIIMLQFYSQYLHQFSELASF